MTNRVVVEVTRRSQATDQAAALALLQRALDNPDADFRPGQWEAIDVTP